MSLFQSLIKRWLPVHAKIQNSPFKLFKYHRCLTRLRTFNKRKKKKEEKRRNIKHTCRDVHRHVLQRSEIEATSTHTEKQAFSMIQGTLSFGSLSERIDFDLSGVDFQEQIIEPLNLICCLQSPQRTVST